MVGLTVFTPKTYHQAFFPLSANLFPAAASSRNNGLCSPRLSSDNVTFAKTSLKQSYSRATIKEQDSCRPLINFPPSVWGDRFLSVPFNESKLEALEREIEALKPKVRSQLISSTSNPVEKVCLINLLTRLGVSYHFESEIEQNLKHAFDEIQKIIYNVDDLYTVSLMFRVFRQYGHNMSCDVFNGFKDEDANFKNGLLRDVKGMLSLYEAANLGIHGEDIMDEALNFTSNNLESLAVQAEPHVARLIHNSLYRPQHHDMEILDAREYVSFYEQEQDHDEMLLKFAKINFNYLQLKYLQELRVVTSWWKDLNLMSELPYVRDRMVECYFWATGIYFEPQYSRARIMLAKFVMLLTLMDDTYDAYGTLAEVKSLTEAVERWDPDIMSKLPDYIKTVFRFFLDYFEEIEREVRPEGRSYSVHHTIEEFKGIIRANLATAKWARDGRVPTYDEYMEVGRVTGGIYVLGAACFVGMGRIAGREAYDWIKSKPKIIDALDLKARLIDDIVTYKDEMGRGEIATGINCYMKQYGVTEEEAFTELRKRLRETYKTVNEEFLKTKAVPRQLLVKILNFGRIMDVNYKYVDGLTYPEGRIKDYITSLFLEPIPL